MDAKKRELIERFTLAVSCHGPQLARHTAVEQVTDDGGLFDFLSPSCANVSAASFYRNKLQVHAGETWAPEAQSTAHSLHQVHVHYGLSSLPASSEQQPVRGPSDNDKFMNEIQQFIATKADIIFQMRSNEHFRRGADYGFDTSHAVLASHAETPPLESFMEIPAHIRRQELFKVFKIGDIIIGEVVSKRPFGIFVKIRNLEFGVNRDFTDLDIQALCRTSELEVLFGSREFHDAVDAFVIGDLVRGVICGISDEEQRVSLSFRPSKVPPQHADVKLGIIEDTDSLVKSPTRYEEGTSFNDYLRQHVGFANPQNVETLINVLGIDTSTPCSLLRSMQSCNYPEEDYFDQLRKKQSAKWSMESTAKGVEHFKAGEYDTAMKYLGHALQIDPENVEALVARGALSANKGKFEIAVDDFRQALALNASHKNARKYLVETLVEQGKKCENESRMPDAVDCFKEVLELESGHAAALEQLERIQKHLASERQRKESASKTDARGDVKSRFSHVRKLIKEDPSLSKKRKKKEKKKRKKKVKNAKKKKRKTYPTKKSSSTESCSSHGSSSCSSSDDGWVEKPRSPERSRLGASHDNTDIATGTRGTEFSHMTLQGRGALADVSRAGASSRMSEAGLRIPTMHEVFEAAAMEKNGNERRTSHGSSMEVLQQRPQTHNSADTTNRKGMQQKNLGELETIRGRKNGGRQSRSRSRNPERRSSSRNRKRSRSVEMGKWGVKQNRRRKRSRSGSLSRSSGRIKSRNRMSRSSSSCSRERDKTRNNNTRETRNKRSRSKGRNIKSRSRSRTSRRAKLPRSSSRSRNRDRNRRYGSSRSSSSSSNSSSNYSQEKGKIRNSKTRRSRRGRSRSWSLPRNKRRSKSSDRSSSSSNYSQEKGKRRNSKTRGSRRSRSRSWSLPRNKRRSKSSGRSSSSNCSRKKGKRRNSKTRRSRRGRSRSWSLPRNKRRSKSSDRSSSSSNCSRKKGKRRNSKTRGSRRSRSRSWSLPRNRRRSRSSDSNSSNCSRKKGKRRNSKTRGSRRSRSRSWSLPRNRRRSRSSDSNSSNCSRKKGKRRNSKTRGSRRSRGRSWSLPRNRRRSRSSDSNSSNCSRKKGKRRNSKTRGSRRSRSRSWSLPRNRRRSRSSGRSSSSSNCSRIKGKR